MPPGDAEEEEEEREEGSVRSCLEGEKGVFRLEDPDEISLFG